ncbi:DUF192 domain-containing protein [Streptomyces sp. NPDC003691]
MGRERRWRSGTGTLRILAGEAANGTSSTGGTSAGRTSAPGAVAGTGAPAPDPVAAPGAPAVPAGIPLEIAASYGTRRRGLLGRDGIDGAILLTPCNAVHTLGMRFAVDVAYLDAELRVVARHTLPPHRLALPRLRARHVLESAAGAMERWGVRPGVRLAVEQAPEDGFRAGAAE